MLVLSPLRRTQSGSPASSWTAISVCAKLKHFPARVREARAFPPANHVRILRLAARMQIPKRWNRICPRRLGLSVEIVDRGGAGEVRVRYTSLEQLDGLCQRLGGG